jgi:hypothetical protein
VHDPKATSARNMPFFGRMGTMRKQFNFWPGRDGLDAWDVDRLVKLSADLPARPIPLNSIKELDTAYWSIGERDFPTVNQIIRHFQLVHEVDMAFPIILNVDGRVMDGMHRVARAVLEGAPTIMAVQYEYQPEPDFVGCTPENLPYWCRDKSCGGPMYPILSS